jgi:hypothetical protein
VGLVASGAVGEALEGLVWETARFAASWSWAMVASGWAMVFGGGVVVGAVAVFVSPMRGRFITLVEVKSKCTLHTEQAELTIAMHYGQYHSVNAMDDSMAFKESIPDATYRGQLVHGMCCAGVNDAIFVVASLRWILHVVHVSISNMFRGQYMSAIGDIGRDHLSWVANNVVPEDMSFKDDSHAVDRHSVQTTLELSNAMVAMISVRGRPLPAGRHLVPELISEWNRGKGPIDGYSRFQKNVKAQHSHLGPVAAIWLRLTMTMVYQPIPSKLHLVLSGN